ncbi:MAG: hypothetical protein ACFCVA_13015 [Gammaproteobacteria bacterium]
MSSSAPTAAPESLGSTPSERYLTRLARRSFLTLWSYPNLYTDEGRHGSHGDGKELCDLLVIFDKHVLLFSDKHCEFPEGIDLAVAWARWYRRAVEKSARQLIGARNWVTRFPTRIYVDKGCERPLPIPIPGADTARFHLVAVTRGAYDACRAFFSGGSTGSLALNTSVVGEDHHSRPFVIGRVVRNGPYIHVLDELTLDVLLRELDTVKDFIEYLERKEILLTHPKRTLIATGEEQLVAMYLTRTDEHGDHAFTEINEDADVVFVPEGRWEDFIQNPQYIAKKRADGPSYVWDRLIEHMAARGEFDTGGPKTRDVTSMERGLRALAAEPRIARRQYARHLLEALAKDVKPGQCFLRVGYSGRQGDTAYVFLILPQPPHIATYDEYREARRAMLLACCKVARLRTTHAPLIVGLATEPGGTPGASEDLLVLEV